MIDVHAVVHAADFKYLSQTGKWTFEGQYLYSDRGVFGDGNGATLDIDYAPRQGLKHSLGLTDFDPGFDVNDFGFQGRDDLKFLRWNSEWIKSGLTRVRDIKLTGWYAYGENDAGLDSRFGAAGCPVW